MPLKKATFTHGIVKKGLSIPVKKYRARNKTPGQGTEHTIPLLARTCDPEHGVWGVIDYVRRPFMPTEQTNKLITK